MEGICVFYSSYLIVSVVLRCFSPGNLRLLAFSLYSPGLWEGLLTLLLTPYFASVYVGLTLGQPTLVQLS